MKLQAYIKEDQKTPSRRPTASTSRYDGAPRLRPSTPPQTAQRRTQAPFGPEVPYLKSVSSPKPATACRISVSRVECSELDFRATILYLRPGADMTGDASAWVGKKRALLLRPRRGVSIGGVSFTGGELGAALQAPLDRFW